ncbi:hypothetical protein PM082_018491 [Marasmius tenuissimus]|nr:hypothetical protein PM082_018491 [Marasmius tenuissimus]
MAVKPATTTIATPIDTPALSSETTRSTILSTTSEQLVTFKPVIERLAAGFHVGNNPFLKHDKLRIIESASSTVTLPSSSGKENSPKAFIIGSVIGGTGFIVSLTVLILLFLRRCRRPDKPNNLEEFRRYLMVLNTVTTEAYSGSRSSRMERGIGKAGGARHMEIDSISLTTHLREEFEDKKTAGAWKAAQYTLVPVRTASEISGRIAASRVPNVIAPLIPVSINPTSSPAHLRVPSRARTDRQMQIEQKIFKLQALFITANGSGEKSRTRAELKERIDKVKDLRES